MKKQNGKKRLRLVLRWIAWIFLIQFILINISAAFYADKFTHLYSTEEKQKESPPSGNIFSKTWRLFTGSRFYKQPEQDKPTFPYSTVHLLTKEKIPIEAWYCRTDSAAKGTFILLHGLMGNKSFLIWQAKKFLDRGYNVMLFDIRGHGNSGGHRTSYGYDETEETKLAYDYVKAKGEKAIFLWGFSLGAVEIIKAVADYNLEAAGVILEMPFGSLQAHIKSRMHVIGFPRQPFGFLITFWIGVERGFNGLGFKLDHYAKKIHCPVLIQCAKKDQFVLRSEIDDIFNAIPSPQKKLTVYEEVYHESLLQKDPVRWEKEIDEFLAERK